MTWTTEKIKQLKKLWSKGKSTVEIGRELGISKNAVVGKVHRLELNARPSPIKKTTTPKPVKKKVQKEGNVSLLDLKLNSCRWPIGEPKDADFHFCGKDTVTGKPYCREHCKLAYTSLKELATQNKTEAKKEETSIKAETSKASKTTKEETPKQESPKKSVKKQAEKTPEKTVKSSTEKTKKTTAKENTKNGVQKKAKK